MVVRQPVNTAYAEKHAKGCPDTRAARSQECTRVELGRSRVSDLRDWPDESTIPFSTPAVETVLETSGPRRRPHANADELLLDEHNHPSPSLCDCSNPVDAKWIYNTTNVRSAVRPVAVKHLLAIAEASKKPSRASLHYGV